MLPSSSDARQLDSCLNGLRTGIPEEERIERRMGHDREEPFDELKVGFVKGDTAL